MTPECQNCGAFVSDDYLRVFEPEGVEQPRACPHCEDMVRAGSQVREAKSSRSRARTVEGR